MAKTKTTIQPKKRTGRRMPSRRWARTGTSDSAKVATETKASDQRASMSAAAKAKASTAQIAPAASITGCDLRNPVNSSATTNR